MGQPHYLSVIHNLRVAEELDKVILVAQKRLEQLGKEQLNQTRYVRYVASKKAQAFFAKHNTTETGYWLVCAANTDTVDFACKQEPRVYKGVLRNVVMRAIEDTDFWGNDPDVYGCIRKIPVIDLTGIAS